MSHASSEDDVFDRNTVIQLVHLYSHNFIKKNSVNQIYRTFFNGSMFLLSQIEKVTRQK